MVMREWDAALSPEASIPCTRHREFIHRWMAPRWCCRVDRAWRGSVAYAAAFRMPAWFASRRARQLS